ncbi:MAG: excisionase family DNA-binding protein [Actinomycetota bacterium]|nr:excisionase family DNA-binding protein [Actinomycetota bacterium]MDA8197000.1 excisionase family DNA-binding protein [Actinomycetota bacterium]
MVSQALTTLPPLGEGEATNLKAKVSGVRDSKNRIQISIDGAIADLPEGAEAAIAFLLRKYAEGHGIVVGILDSKLTTAQAGEILGLSRPYVVKLIERGDIPFTFAGTHRRMLLRDVLLYKEKLQRHRSTKLDELAALSDRLGLYDNDF